MAQSFDYIIIGAGSAGCVLANRLSKNPAVSVCLVEAGGSDKDLRVKVPAGILALYGNKRFDYCYTGVPQAELNGRRIPVNRGKMLGGSSGINSMVYIRGSRADYDRWENSGCAGWSYDDVLPVFKSLERNRVNQDAEFHGFDGELLVDDPRDPNQLSEVFVSAGESVGLPNNTDFNASEQFGLGIYNVTQDRGSRFSSYTAFINPVVDRKNLSVLSNASLQQLNIEDRKVVSVRLVVAGEVQTLTCNREVILSAGTINTPALLLQSGIGPEAELIAEGVKPVLNLPGVGKNLQDHIDGMITVRSSSRRTLGLSLANMPAILSSPINYFARKRGMLTTNYVEAGGFARTRFADEQPDIQFHFVPGYRSHRGKLVEYGHGYAIHTCVLQPKSRGDIRISRGANGVDIQIDNRFFSDPQDSATLVEGIRVARSIFAAQHFDTYRGVEMLPGNDVQSDDEMLDYLRAEALTVYHPAGSCKMGIDDMAVVAPDSLKVHGMQNLRIADASIMPYLISGNTNAPSMMIGQRAATMILNDA